MVVRIIVDNRLELMMTLRRTAWLLSLALLIAPSMLRAQLDEEVPIADYDDQHGELPPAGLPDIYSASSVGGYGYGYDSLLADIAVWTKSPNVTVGTIGNSVEGRAIWQVQITSPANLIVPREVITIHARTHPNEPQSSYVANALIDHLLSDDPAMRKLLEKSLFNIIPMLNPDGVEAESGRLNANGVDLEREWDKDPAEIEAAQLKARYGAMMSSPSPIRVALNFHSAYLCKRYFVYHVPESTSDGFAQLEQRFISAVRRYFMSGIEPWEFYQSWKDGAPTHFPESWFWSNYREQVMALTYEDMHCETNGAYDTTAYAILRGIADYLQIDIAAIASDRATTKRSLLRSVAPNPFATGAVIKYSLPTGSHVTVRVHDGLGAEVARLFDDAQEPGWHEIRWDAPGVPNGVYYVTLQAGPVTNTLPVLKIR
jgi:hypothetical protein